MATRPAELVRRGMELLQQAVCRVLEDASGGPMSTSDIADALRQPHGGAEWHHHFVKQLLFHMQRDGLIEDVRPHEYTGHQWAASAKPVT